MKKKSPVPKLPTQITLPNGEKVKVDDQSFKYPKSLREYIQGECHFSASREILAIPTFFPCRTCKGAGVIWDPNDPPDPMEGNKCRRRITCTTCKGSKTAPKAEWTAAYTALKNRRTAQKNLAAQSLSALQKSLKRISAKDWELLKKHFNLNPQFRLQ